MEGAGHRGRWNKKAPVGTTLLLLLMCTLTLVLSEPSEDECSSDEYYSTEYKVCCNRCFPGTKLTEECHEKGQRSNCTDCPEDQFMENKNFARNCRRCRTCTKPNEFQVEPCRGDRNTICQCNVGHYKYVIDGDTYECRKCKSCGIYERKEQECTPQKNTVCGCKEEYYKVKNKCEPCKNCTSDCEHLCPYRTMIPIAPSDGNQHLIHTIIGIASGGVLLMVLGVIVTHMVTKWVTKKNLPRESIKSSSDSQDSCKVLIEKPPSDTSVTSIQPTKSPVIEQQLPNLPDCVPLEIKIPELIYTVLDLVPVQQVKQLVRTLGVTDTEIEQAQMDHKSCRESHYQMLRVWAERGSHAGARGRGDMLHWLLMQDLLDKLRKMHLGRAAEELETIYGIQ